MLKTPISFKGPAGQLQALMTEQQALQIWRLLQDNVLINWRYDDESQLTHATWDGDETWHMSMSWPPQEPLGTCSCDESKPCLHLLALAAYNKFKLDQLSPFTRQVRAVQDIGQTFVNWLNQQHHDPFPNMARHRVIYVIDPETNPWRLRLFKAYLSQEDTFAVKANIDSSLLGKKQLPKFMSLADQGVMHGMHQVGLTKDHEISLDPGRDQDWLLDAIKTGRAFWKACYRPPLRLNKVTKTPQASVAFSDKVHFSPQHNTVSVVEALVKQQAGKAPQGELMPCLDIQSQLLSVPWTNSGAITVDWAQIRFETNDISFSLADVETGLIELDEEQVQSIAAYCYQLEKWPSMKASHDAPLVEGFEVNDRSLPTDFVAILPTLQALHLHGWHITINANHRLNRSEVSAYYLDVQQQKLGRGWFDLDLGIEVDGQKVSLQPFLLKAIKNDAFDDLQDELLMAMDDGRLVGLNPTLIEQIVHTFGELYDQPSKGEQLKVNQHQLMRVVAIQHHWAQNDQNPTLRWLGDEAIKDQINQLSQIHQLPSVDIPSGLQAELRAYQKTGLDWLAFLHANQLHGLLADDMGLGKTIQVLAHLLRLKEQGELEEPVLILTPTSLLGNWVAEARRFAPGLRVTAGLGQQRQHIYANLEEWDVVVLSYGVAARDVARLHKQNWSVMVLDEAQAIKNSRTQTSQVVKSLPAKHRLCLSGTPIENHLGEMWSLFDFLMPGLLGSAKQFKHWFQHPIEKEDDKGRMEALKQRLGPLILRRNKHDVATELPPKTEIVQHLSLLPEQAAIYESVRLSMAKEIRAAIQANQQTPLIIGNALLRLRQVCCHPAMVPLEHLDESIDAVKMHWLRTTLPNIVETGGRILIFSSFTKALDLIATCLDGLGIGHRSLTGKIPAKQRTEDITAFQNQTYPVYLISLKAGGAGINLTEADTVIHFDPWWNPAAEAQASDRAHRIGQNREVFVYKLITKGTVEEKIHLMQQHKQKLSAEVLNQQTSIDAILNEQNWETMLAPITGTN